MAFTCHLTRPTMASAAAFDDDAFREAGTDYESLVMIACGQLHETDCRFHMSGFGHDDWWMDVQYDMSVFVEQLPDLLAAISARRRAVVDLYSQGLERSLTFLPVGGGWEVHCRSRTGWVPSPAVEVVAVDVFSRLAVDFAESLVVIGSLVARVAPFAGWLSRG